MKSVFVNFWFQLINFGYLIVLKKLMLLLPISIFDLCSKFFIMVLFLVFPLYSVTLLVLTIPKNLSIPFLVKIFTIFFLNFLTVIHDVLSSDYLPLKTKTNHQVFDYLINFFILQYLLLSWFFAIFLTLSSVVSYLIMINLNRFSTKQDYLQLHLYFLVYYPIIFILPSSFNPLPFLRESFSLLLEVCLEVHNS